MPLPLSAVGLGMRFDEKWVLRGVDMTIAPGEIHGLVGHNGSGKSTLIKILAGYHQPAEGRVLLDDDVVSQGSPLHSYELGLRFVHQDLGLIGEFSALENFGIGGRYSTGKWGSIDWRRQRDRLGRVLKTLGSSLPVDVAVSKLPAVERTLVAIARAVGGGPENSARTRFLVLDEPTGALEGPEVAQLFEVVRSLAGSGMGVVFVSHQLKEVLDLCGPVTVLRDGRLVETLSAKTISHGELVQAMLGAALPHLADRPASAASARGPGRRRGAEPADPLAGRAVVRVTGLTSRLLRGVDLDLAPHECVCVLGLSGSGREELVYAIAGAVSSKVARMEVDGRVIPQLRTVDCRKNRIALVPGNRMPGSLVAEFSVRENLTFASLRAYRKRWGSVDRKAERVDTHSWLGRFDIRPPEPEYVTRNLSGGNKQKVILAKWLAIDPLAMFIDEPTVGVDVGVARRIMEELRALVNRGMSLLITTSEVDDAVAVADRVIVLSEGRVIRELRRGNGGITEASILSAMSRSGIEGTPAGYVSNREPS
jgi:ribose transport system ATP-binding protein